MHKFLGSIAFSVLVACVSTGCSVSTVEQQERPAADRYSAVSFTNAGFEPAMGESFGWYGPPVWADSTRSSVQRVLSLQLQSAINDWLRSRGYQVVQEGADYLIGVAIVMEEGERSDEINDFFSLFPQLATSEAGYDKGRILAGVVPGYKAPDPDTQLDTSELLWRSAIEAYVLDLEPGTPESKARIAGLTNILLNTLPGSLALY